MHGSPVQATGESPKGVAHAVVIGMESSPPWGILSGLCLESSPVSVSVS